MLIDLVVPGLSVAAGGPTRTVVQLADSLAGLSKTRVRLVSQSHVGDQILLPRRSEVDRFIGDASCHATLKFGLSGLRAMHNAHSQQPPNIYHSNGIWHPINHWVAMMARRHQIPLIIQPRGMLEPWAMGWHSLRKRVALGMYQHRDLDTAVLLVATSEQEADNLRRFGLHQPIAVIPNGVEMRAAQSSSCTHLAGAADARHALFMGRVHPKKGLENLLRAWAAAKPFGWLLQIAGPDEGGHLATVLTLAKRLGISDQVEYLGVVSDQEKWAVYRAANLFVLPTFSENFGVVVAEALSEGLPVITTTGAPWEDLKTYDCGWWVEPSEQGLLMALRDATSSSPERLRTMGAGGRAYVQRYDWSILASQMRDVYHWVLDRGPVPQCIRFD